MTCCRRCLKLRGRRSLKLRGTVTFYGPINLHMNQIDEIAGVTFELISCDMVSASDTTGVVSPKARLQKSPVALANGGSASALTFIVPKDFGKPGALLVTNNHRDEFFLEAVTISHGEGNTQKTHFLCYSWIYNAQNYDGPRVFFTNQACLPSQTPVGIRALLNAELKKLQGDGTGERKKVDRIYDYDVYNDLGNPDKGEEFARPTLGGSHEYPYPRRCRTGRAHNESDPETEKPTALLELIYVPRDEIFDHTKTVEFLSSSLGAVLQLLLPAIKHVFKGTDHFSSFEEVSQLYYGSGQSSCEEGHKSYFEVISNLLSPWTASTVKFPLPSIIRTSKDAWSTDEEFARQTLGGMHPIIIERVKVFPLLSNLDPQVYGPSASSIKSHHIEPYLEGMTAQEAVQQNKLYMLDYHDSFLPYIQRINSMEGHRAYASRTIFFLTKKGALMPVAIELSLPSSNGRVDRVFVPPVTSDEDQQWLWKLAKVHAILNDTPVHQLSSHFLRTHASIEPFIIASYRQLSVIHPLFVLLLPHLKQTLNLYAIARKVLVNAYTGNVIHGGFVERTFTAGRYAMELSSTLYKSWRFDEQGLPYDLLKRGMAERDPMAKHGLRLLIEDYPYAVDGLDVWEAIRIWVNDYVNIYYRKEEDVREDVELQRWWHEVKEKGHADKRAEPGWPIMDSIDSLIMVITTIIWLASAHHAAVNFGQYPYAGYMPYRPTMGGHLIPLPDTPQYAAFAKNRESYFLSCVSSPTQATLGLAIIELLSTHPSNEEYLGERATPLWTDNAEVMEAFRRFQERLVGVERAINERNKDPSLGNRYGEVQVPYTLLLPTSGGGITGRGIPNSTSV